MADSGIKAVIARELARQQPRENQSMLGHTFVGYRRKGFEFEAIFKLGERENRLPQYTCENVVKNTSPGTEIHEACKQALEHWPR